MKTLYESILDTEKDYDSDILIKSLFSKDLQQRRRGFDNLLLKVESYHPKEHKNTAKMKNSDSYFIEFVQPIKIENGDATEILDYISYIQVCKRIGLSYRTVCIDASDGRFSGKIDVYENNWSYTQPNFTPKAKNTKLYEVPEELNGLFRQIQAEAYKHR
jgi:hypothetical protein